MKRTTTAAFALAFIFGATAAHADDLQVRVVDWTAGITLTVHDGDANDLSTNAHEVVVSNSLLESFFPAITQGSSITAVSNNSDYTDDFRFVDLTESIHTSVGGHYIGVYASDVDFLYPLTTPRELSSSYSASFLHTTTNSYANFGASAGLTNQAFDFYSLNTVDTPVGHYNSTGSLPNSYHLDQGPVDFNNGGASYSLSTGTEALLDKDASLIVSHDLVTATPAATPEPASLAALGLGAIALIRRRRASK